MKNLTTNIAAIVEAIRQEKQAIYTRAEDHRQQLERAYAALGEDASDLVEINEVVDDMIAALSEAALDIDNTIDSIDKALEGANDLSPVPFQTFIDFCESCGEPVTVGDTYTTQGGEVYCATCSTPTVEA